MDGDGFYVEMFLKWSAILFLLIVIVKGASDEIKLLKYHKLTVILSIIIYCAIISFFQNTSFVRPILSECKLSELEVSEGIGKIHGTAKADLLYLDNVRKSYYFDFSLCVFHIDKRSLADQHLKIWHKGIMVYQLSKNGEIIFSIDSANSAIDKYNLLVVPLSYLVIGILVFMFCLGRIQSKMKSEDQE